jgi:predicted ATPase
VTDDLVVITGGPGSGKSTLIDALALEGFSRMPEGGRAIIQDQVAIGGQALPWADRVAFSELMLAWDLRSYREAQALPAPIIFDRGIPDVVGYLTLCGLPVPPHVRKAAQLHRYRRQVFIAPVWPDIFIGDAERKQSLAEARATYRVIAATYADLGYEPVHLPLASVAERVDFVRQRLG